MARAWTEPDRKRFSTPFAKAKLPPDPDGMNDECARFAERAIGRYRKAHRMGRNEALVSLLVGLQHLCDLDTRYGDFEEEALLASVIYDDNTRASSEAKNVLSW